MLDFPVIDTHVHLWDPAHLEYPWHRGNAELDRPFLMDEFDAARVSVNIGGIVFVECDVLASQRLDEAHWISSLAEADPRIKGIVASAALEHGQAVQDDLEKLASVPLVKGVRRLIQSEDLDFCTQPDFVQGVKALAEFGLSFDICIRHPQLTSATQLVRSCPEVPFILDHIGKPDIAHGGFEPWAQELREFARLPNVYCKMSGLITEADRACWTKDDLRPYIEHVIECFGWDRVTYGGDWPVATLAATYTEWFEALEWAVAGCSETEKQKLFRETAKQFYRL